MPFKNNNPGCDSCGCACESKDTYGFPDVIAVAFELLTSTSEGLPSNTPFVTCFSGEVYEAQSYNNWTADTWFIELLESGGPWMFDYSHQEAPCCFVWNARTEVVSDDCREAVNRVVFGASPVGDYWLRTEGTTCTGTAGAVTGTPTCDPPEAADEICDCCESSSYINEGERFRQLQVIGTMQLRICVSGDVVTVEISIVYEMVCYQENGRSVGGTVPTEECPPQWIPCLGCYPDLGDCELLEPAGCNYDGDTFGLEGSFDTSGETGSDLWEKMEGHQFESAFETATCSCSGGCECDDGGGDPVCVDIYYEGCLRLPACVPICGSEVDTQTPVPASALDRQCFFAAGTLGYTLTEGV